MHVMLSLEGGRGCGISRPVRTSREKDTRRSAFSRESNGRVIIGLGRGGRGVCPSTLAGGSGELLSCTMRGSHRTHRSNVVTRMLYKMFLIAPSELMNSVQHTRKQPAVPASQAARNVILETTDFGVASWVLIGLESTPACLNGMIHGTDGMYTGQWRAGGNKNATTTEVGEAGVTIGAGEAQAEDESWGGDI